MKALPEPNERVAEQADSKGVVHAGQDAGIFRISSEASGKYVYLELQLTARDTARQVVRLVAPCNP